MRFCDNRKALSEMKARLEEEGEGRRELARLGGLGEEVEKVHVRYSPSPSPYTRAINH